MPALSATKRVHAGRQTLEGYILGLGPVGYWPVREAAVAESNRMLLQALDKRMDVIQGDVREIRTAISTYKKNGGGK